MRSYKHLTQEQRYQIAFHLKENRGLRRIAREIGVHHTTVAREIERNSVGTRYFPKQAQRQADLRRADKRWRRIPRRVWRLVERLLRWFQWSPEQISGRLGLRLGLRISHERIYQHVLEDKRRGGTLYKQLRCQKKRRKRYGSPRRATNIPARVGIEERPAIAQRRERLGDWEADTIVDRGQRHAIVTLVDRRSRLVRIARVARKGAQEVAQAMISLLAPLQPHVRTVTCDNGSEFTRHASLTTSLKAAVYFANPYCSWERGSNENTNGLLRQYFPKGSDFSKYSDAQLHAAAQKLNNRPRKRLGYRTPNEVFFDKSISGALGS